VTDSAISFEAEPPSAAEMAARMRAAHVWLVSERDGRVVGYAYGGTHRTRAAYDRTVEVSAYFDRDTQRGGIGRELYLALFDELKERGYRLLVAGITLPNEPSVGFHQALGFSRVGIFKNIGFKFGTWYDVGWWQLDLGEPGGA
jgi:L-amino acid N-acyltransferase YncA